jgi:hypothetical protein
MASKRGAYQRRGRAALLGAGAVFVLAQLIGGLLLDWRGLPVRFPSAAQVLAAAPRGAGRPAVVFLGSSRFQGLYAGEAAALLRQEHPDAGPVEVCNAAVPAGDPIAEDYVMERLLAQGSRPRLAVIEVGPDTVNRYNEFFALHCHRQITWWDVVRYLPDVCRAGQLRKLAASRLVPLYAHRRELGRQAGLALAAAFSASPAPPAPDPGLPAGAPVAWDALLQVPLPPLSPAEVEAKKEMAVGVEKRFRDYQPGGTTAAALERMLGRCRANGVEVVLVAPPGATFFREKCTPEIDAAFTGYVGRLARAYGCRFLDCRDALPDQLFADLVHLNEPGGHYFTRKLTHEVLSPWLGEKLAAAGR